MKKIFAIFMVLSLLGCNSTYQDLSNKYIKSDNKKTTTKTKKAIEKHKLFVNVVPASSAIYITNIKPKFKQGIELNDGQYKVKIKKQGYKTVQKTVSFSRNDTNKTLNIELKKDMLAFKTSKNTRVIKSYRHMGSAKYRLFDKHSLSMAIAALIEWNNGKTEYPWKPRYRNATTIDVKKALFKRAYDNIDDNLYFQKNYQIVKSYEDKTNKKFESLRPKTKKYLDSMYVFKLKMKITESNFAELYDNEDEIFSPEISWEHMFGFSSHLDKNIDYVNKKSLKKDLGRGYPTFPDIVYAGKMSPKKLSIKNISSDRIIKFWESMPAWGKNNNMEMEKFLEIEVLTKISNVTINPYDGDEILFTFQPTQFKIKGLNIKQDI